MRSVASLHVAALASGLLVLGLAACGNKSDSSTAGQKMDAAVAKTEQAVDQAKAKAAEVGTAVADKVDDAAITASVSSALVKDSELSAIKIDVDTKSGVVMLNGPAPNAAAKSRAEDIAKSVTGVSSVVNKLEVKAM